MTWHLVVTDRGHENLSQAFGRIAGHRIEVMSSDEACESFEDIEFGQGECRQIGEVTWNPRLRRLRVWVRSDATRDDTIAAVRAARILYGSGHPDLTRSHWRHDDPSDIWSADLCRRLDEYGNDLGLVVGLTEMSTADSLLNLASTAS